MTGEEYREAAKKTANENASEWLCKQVNSFSTYPEKGGEPGCDVGLLMNGVLGLTGEAGEVSDLVKKNIFHHQEWDEIHFKKELGDVLWYIALICTAMGYNMDEIMQMNIDKLTKRYHGGTFNAYDATHKSKEDV